MTLPAAGAKSKPEVVEQPVSLYAQWRWRSGAVPCLHEDGAPPPERLLQAIWYHQRLRRDSLVTLDGDPLVVLHPGFWNYEGGPDFRGAVLQWPGGDVRRGDVEIDVEPAGWHQHGHDTNPAFRNVLLHVVWEGDNRSGHPTLVLAGVLDAPLSELAMWLGSEAAEQVPPLLVGQCGAPLAELDRGAVVELLRAAARVRLQSKGTRLQARAREAGWEQALWEGLFRALGYKHNVWPMQRLGELRPRICDPHSDQVLIQARLFGLSGLLPGELTRRTAAADAYIRGLWSRWWRECAGWGDTVLPRALWHLRGLRPANHPHRRLALATRWLGFGDLPARLERWCAAVWPGNKMVSALLDELRVGPDPFWSWHWTLRSGRLARPQPLLGEGRLTDLAVNVILPWLWIRAGEGRNAALQAEMERRYFSWPAGQDNAVLRLAGERLFGGRKVCELKLAAEQQGLLQIVEDFCDQSDSICTRCQFPLLVKMWGGES